MTKVITVTLRKGGSGKTTTALSLASGLSKQGQRVLILDLDDQANVATALGFDRPDIVITDVLRGKASIDEAIVDTTKGFDMIASDLVLAQIEATLAADPTKYANVLKGFIDQLRPKYDYIIIDTPPREGMLTIAALTTSDYALIPAQAHYLALHGLQQALDLVQRVKASYNPSLQILGILPTMVQGNTNVAQLFIDKVQADYPALLLPFTIPYSIRLSESQLAGETIIDYEPRHPASMAYIELAKHVNGR